MNTANPIPFTLAIPAGFTTGTQVQNLTAVDKYTCQVSLSPRMDLSLSREAHLIQASIPYSQPNIGGASSGVPGFVAGNNRISITWNGGARTDYLFPQGLYGVSDLESQLNQFAATAGWISSAAVSQLFFLTGIPSTQTILLTVDPAVLTGGAFPASGVVIDFLNPGVGALADSIGPVMGWPTTGAAATLTIAGAGTTPVSFLGPNTANLALYTAYALYCSFLLNSYQQGNIGQLLAVFPLGAFKPNSVMSFQPPQVFPIPVAKGVYSVVNFWFTDQLGNRLILNNFQASMEFSFLIT